MRVHLTSLCTVLFSHKFVQKAIQVPQKFGSQHADQNAAAPLAQVTVDGGGEGSGPRNPGSVPSPPPPTSPVDAANALRWDSDEPEAPTPTLRRPPSLPPSPTHWYSSSTSPTPRPRPSSSHPHTRPRPRQADPDHAASGQESRDWLASLARFMREVGVEGGLAEQTLARLLEVGATERQLRTTVTAEELKGIGLLLGPRSACVRACSFPTAHPRRCLFPLAYTAFPPQYPSCPQLAPGLRLCRLCRLS